MNSDGRSQMLPRFVQGSGTIRLIRQRFYTIGEVALMLRVHEKTVLRWLRQGQLGAVTYGANGPVRIRGEQIMKFLRPYAPAHKRIAAQGEQPATQRSRAARRSKPRQQ